MPRDPEESRQARHQNGGTGRASMNQGCGELQGKRRAYSGQASIRGGMGVVNATTEARAGELSIAIVGQVQPRGGEGGKERKEKKRKERKRRKGKIDTPQSRVHDMGCNRICSSQISIRRTFVKSSLSDDCQNWNRCTELSNLVLDLHRPL